jgi:DNA-3-methyladenine glycosylase
MFGKAGVWYVYLIYGMHHCLNIVTGPAEYPAAVLIRGVRIAGKELKGPGRVGRFFRIGRELNGAGADARSGLWIEDRGVKIGPRRIGRGKRIGVDYAGNWKNRLWRFFLKQRGGKKRSRVPPFS